MPYDIKANTTKIEITLRRIQQALDDIDVRIAGGGGGGGAVWGAISGTLSAQTDLDAALDGKASLVHGHSISNVTGLQAALDGKMPLTAGFYFPAGF